MIGGLCGAVDPSLRPGDLVVASEVRGDGAPIACATDLAALLGARVGPIVSLDHVAGPRSARACGPPARSPSTWSRTGSRATQASRPVAVVRAVVDTAGRRLLDPRTLVAGIRGLLALRRAAPVLRA